MMLISSFRSMGIDLAQAGGLRYLNKIGVVFCDTDHGKKGIFLMVRRIGMALCFSKNFKSLMDGMACITGMNYGKRKNTTMKNGQFRSVDLKTTQKSIQSP